MATGKASVRLHGRFPEGTKVALYARFGDFFTGGGDVLARATVNRRQEVEFKSRQDGEKLWIVGDVDGTARAVRVTAKDPAETRQRLSASAVRERLAQTRPAVDDRTRVTGARGTRSVGRHGQPFAHPAVGQATAKADQTIEPHPAPRTEDVKGPKRSDTVTGTAESVAKDEVQPGIKQEDVPAGTPQRSSTPLGTSTVIPVGEDGNPGTRQEDVPAGVRQRSDTPHGTATPLPESAQPPSKKKAARKAGAKKKPASKSRNRTANTRKSAAKKRTTQRKQARAAKSRRTGRAKK